MTGTWNPSDNAGLSFSNGNLTATNLTGSGVWYTCRAIPLFEPTNRVYAEFTASNVGVSDSAVYIAVMTGNAALSVPGLFDANSFGYNQDGSTTYNGTGATLATWTTGNVICIAVDGTVGKIWARVNGGNWDNDGSGLANPVTNVGGISCPNLFTQGPLYFGTSIHTVNYAVTGNFNGTFAFTVPSGFTAMPPVTSPSINSIAAIATAGTFLTNASVSPKLIGQVATGRVAVVLPTTSAISSIVCTALNGALTSKLLKLTLSGVVATAVANFVAVATATTVYNYEGFDHQSAQSDLLAGTIWTFINSIGSLSANTPYGTGNSLAVQVSAAALANPGYAVYNCGPATLPRAVLGVMTQSSIFTNLGTDIGFMSGPIVQIFCRLIGSTIFVYRGSPSAPTLISTILNVIPASGWFYLELSVVIAASSGGSLVINVNGTQVASYSSITTSSDGTPRLNGILLGGLSAKNTTNTYLFDDIYVATTFLGPLRVVTMFPSGNGSQVQFLTNGAVNFQQVDDIAMDSDSSYNFSSTFALIDEFTMTDVPSTTSNIIALKVTMAARKDALSSRSMGTLVLSSATIGNGVSYVLFNNYQYFSDIYLLDPHTATSWTNAAINAVQIGYKIR
jgi:hypothetical protein